MADLKVRLIWDDVNGKAFLSGVRTHAQEIESFLAKTNTTLASNRFNIQPLTRAQSGLALRPLKTIINATDDVIEHVNQLGIQLARFDAVTGKFTTPDFLPLTKVSTYESNVKSFINSVSQEADAVAKLAVIKKREEALLNNIGTRTLARADEIKAPAAARQSFLTGLLAQRTALNAEITKQRGIASENVGIVQQNAEKRLNELLVQRVALTKDIRRAQDSLTAAKRQETTLLKTDTELLALKARETAVVAASQRGQALQNARIAAAQAVVPATSFPTYANYKAIPPNLLKILQGPGAGLAANVPGLIAQEAQFNEPRFDLVRQVTRFGGQFKTQKGYVADWSAEVDNSGKVITRFGGQLSGVSQTLKQISRDFQKVIEWTVATTVVFGTLQYTISQLSSLKDLDFALQKFAITAQKSPQQAAASFGQLAQISRNTATPLLEIVGAADDIALATQKSGQSTEAWDKQILSLTESVGVFTNLTGIDTVSATDLLTATMKQLKGTASDIPPILSKITAVAGGQSQAIADITKGLSAMAEAGRIANLTIDQQIATIQVLSQVTSKTPAEVATAFKNLVGALGLPLAVKGLAKYGIEVRTTTGELKNILTVYGEISDKIKSGIIPAGDVQGLVRAISGGRTSRQADVAALLGSIDQITATQRKSEQATNEATLANAKAIDTTKAKFIQLQSVIDAVTFEKFGGEFKTFIGTLTNLITNLLKAFNAIPTGVIAASIQIGLFFLAVRLGMRVLGGLVGFLVQASKNYLSLAASIDTATAAQLANTAAASRGPILGPTGAPIASAAGGGRFAGLGSLASKLAGGALVGGALTAFTGGSPLQSIGGAFQGAGLVGISVLPGLTKLIGVAALAGGTFLTFTQGVKDNTEAQQENAIATLNSYAAYKDAITSITAINDEQALLSKSITDLSNTNGKSSEQQAQLLSNQQEYTKNTLDLINATIQLTQARKDLLDHIPQQEAAALEEIRLSKATGEELDKLIFKYQQIVLSRAGLVVPQTSLPGFSAKGNIPESTNTTATRTYGINYPSTGEVPLFLPDTRTTTFDLKELATNADKLKDIFNESGTEIAASFDITQENIGLVNRAIKELASSNPTLAAAMQQTADAFFGQSDAVTELNNNLAAYQAYIDALAQINPTQSASFQKLFNFVNLIKSSVEAGVSNPVIPGAGGRPDVDLQKKAAEFLRYSLETQKIDYSQLKVIALDYYNSLDPKLRQNTDANQFLLQLFQDMKEALTAFGIAGVEAFNEITPEAKAAGEALEQVGKSLEQGISDRLSKVQADLQAGLITPAVAAKTSADLKKFLADIHTTTQAFSTSLQLDPQFGETLNEIQPLFENIIGLENAGALSADQFVEHLLNLADTFGLSGQQLTDLGSKLITFYDLVDQLNKLRVRIPISLDVDSIKRQMVILLRSLANVNPLNWINSPLLRQFFDLQTALDLIGKIGTTSTGINNIFKGGSGTSIGTYPGTTKGGGGRDISELYLPKEIAQATNAQELINQAIRDAKKLQASIPGATKEASNDLVVIIDGLTKVMQVSGVKQEYLQKALDALTEQMQIANSKADVVRRIRIGAGDFSAIANVPVNSTSGVSVAGSNQINITFNLSGTTLTPAEFERLSNMIGAEIARRL